MATLQTLPDQTTLLTTSASAHVGASTLAVRSLLYAIFKHQRLVLGVFLAVFLGSVVAAMIRPSTWLATSKVLVKIGETVQLAPAEAPSRSINMPLNQEVVKTEADIVRSYFVVQEAVKKLGIQPESGSEAELISGLQQGLSVMPTPGTNTLQISFIGKNPEKAARFVNTITDLYIEHHNRVYRREGLNVFYGGQLKLLESQMKEAQDKLRVYLREHGITDAEQEMRILNQDVIEQDKSLKSHRAKILATQRKIAQIDEQIGKTPRQIPFAEEYLSNPTQLTFKNKLAELEVERIRLLERYQPTDRMVLDISQQIANLKTRTGAESGRILNKQTIRHNELYGELERTRISLGSLLADAQAREPSLATRLEASKQRLADLRDKQFAVANLVQEAEQKKYAFDTYFKKQEEARITEAMTDQSVVNVAVLDRAMPPIEPQNGVLLPLLLGIMGGLALSTTMAVAVEFLSRRLRFEEEVERYLELPVLAVIPDLETTPDLARP
jgi:succinoglycan biosynthesis transport protein ExoP